MSHQDKRWVIVFLIYADFRTTDSISMDEKMKGELNVMLEDILTCPLNNTARLYVLLDSIQFVTKEAKDRYSVDERVVLYQIEPSPGYPMNKIGHFKTIEHNIISKDDPVVL